MIAGIEIAAAPGRAALELHLRRPWECDESPAEQLRFVNRVELSSYAVGGLLRLSFWRNASPVTFFDRVEPSRSSSIKAPRTKAAPIEHLR